MSKNRVLNIPTPADFESDALSSLNLAFETFERFIRNHKYVIEDAGDETSDAILHLIKSKSHFINIINLCFLSCELSIKSKICEVSPYLLLEGPRNHPKSANQPLSFGSLRSISASDLKKVCEIFVPDHYSNSGWDFFDKLRKFRNEATHTSMSETPKLLDIFEIITDTCKYFYESKNPFPLRIKLIEESEAILEAPDHLRNWAVYEFDRLRNFFGSKYFKENFGIPDTKLLPCGVCYNSGSDWNDQPGTARIEKDKIYCYACGNHDEYYRRHCIICERPNLFSKIGDICLNCGHSAL
ncbi:hypothetical protein ABWI01_04980 [Oceanicaulis alexandrii]|uniref:hypothetical protein n=1 Tax=Oceanicaulis alexandrii TaxID=153233 RepID=UPI0035CFD0D3